MIIVYDIRVDNGQLIVPCPGEGQEHEIPLDAVPVVDPPADWLMAWASGWMAGYATGHDHGVEDGEQRAAADLAAALDPMRRAAAHGIDVAIARGAWQQHQRRMGGGGA